MNTTSDPVRALRRPRKKLGNRMAALMRWLHIYSSLVGLASVLFFAVTGFTLNHADWFYFGQPTERTERGQLNEDLLHGAKSADRATQSEIQRLELVEYFRRTHHIRAGLKNFVDDDLELMISFAGPAYLADVIVDRQTGDYEIVETYHGLVPLLNDLHKGRDSGAAWSWVIDISAIVLTFVSLTGLSLLVWLRRRYLTGLLSILAGTIILLLIYWISLG